MEPVNGPQHSPNPQPNSATPPTEGQKSARQDRRESGSQRTQARGAGQNRNARDPKNQRDSRANAANTANADKDRTTSAPRRNRNAKPKRDTSATPHVNLARLAKAAEHRANVTVPPITYPEQLPVSARREEIANAIRDNQVVIVAGETGSGKTTQLPKILLDLGRGRKGQIGHTQPRRIAARTVAERIAQEIGTNLGDIVGYQVRFTDESSANTLVRVMTDGILLAQIQRDPQLLAYDTIIIDEAHERSLNIDFLLGYLTNLLPQRPDLKVVITSATIDSERFARHFAPGGPITDDELESQQPLRDPAPVVEVSGRTFPVEIRYRPFDEDDDVDMMSAICTAFDELQREGPGDVLVFLSGERDIHDAEDALRQHLGARANDPRTPGYTQILPLYARLSAAEQHRVFQHHEHRRIVLATNVAETSLTVPGIRYVIDPGTARISRYSKSTKVQRLPIEPVSQASANQRSGRCGRVSDGIAIRLYSEEDFASRPEFTEPEILRTSLASVLLHMVSVGVAKAPGDVAKFPFVEAPDTRAIRDGVAQLQELGALEYRTGRDGEQRTALTAVGRQLAALPMDPRLARMIVEGGKHGVAREVMIIAAVMSIQDPRERPSEVRDLADANHSRFVDGHSDFMTYLNLWEYVRQQQRALSSSAFRRMCKAEYLNFLRIREWQDVVSQLKEMTRSMGIESEVRKPQPLRDKVALDQGITPGGRGRSGETIAQGTAAQAATVQAATSATSASANSTNSAKITPDTKFVWDSQTIHRSLLAGLLSQLGMQEATEVRLNKTGRETAADKRAKRMARNEYLGARGARFAIFPGSPLSKKPPAWVMAGELVETSRLWARDVAMIEPEWAEELAAGIVKRNYSDPHWSTKRGAAIANEKVLLYGVPIVAERPVLYSKVDREAARDMFIRHALVAGEWTTHHKFYAHNRKVLAEAEELEARSRQRGLVVDEEALFAFYDERLPETIVSQRHFDQWWKGARIATPALLDFSLEQLVPEGQDAVSDTDFPQTWVQGDITLPLTYQFSPGSAADGVTVHIPIQLLNRVVPDGFDWMVPGLLDELCVATIRALPKVLRRELVPAPDWGAKIAQWLRENTPAWEDMTRAGDMAESFFGAFQRAVWALKYLEISDDSFSSSTLPGHLQVTFRVFAQRGSGRGAVVDVLGESKDLVALQRTLANAAEDAVRSAVRGAVGAALAEAQAGAQAGANGRKGRGQQPGGSGNTGKLKQNSLGAGPEQITHTISEAEGLEDWPTGGSYDELPLVVEGRGPGGIEVRGYPALIVESQGPKDHTVALRILADQNKQLASQREGVWRLVLGRTALAPARVTSRWTGKQALTLAASPYKNTDALVADVQLAAVMALLPDAGTIRSRADFEDAVTMVRGKIEDEIHRIIGDVVAALSAYRDVDAAVSGNKSLALLATLNDVRAVAGALIYPGFVSATPPAQLRHLARYLRAQVHRIDKAADSVHRDNEIAWKIGNVTDQFTKALGTRNSAGLVGLDNPALVDVKWMIEELRVSMYAVQLGTNGSVSEKRILKAITAAVA
ncbi:ATP-dependent RNA helicase HrpA [Timonella senegalensis]|uniref:ATP-dependent RNA helicase HrpA n=1 Tax=Timonella senegalensis TaxID=1465825 RepID=UPI0009DB4ACD